jgi:hypothetical protein
MATRVYEYMRQPPYLVVQDGDGYWLVPVQAGGWDEREPFVGHVMNLRPLDGPPPPETGIPL